MNYLGSGKVVESISVAEPRTTTLLGRKETPDGNWSSAIYLVRAAGKVDGGKFYVEAERRENGEQADWLLVEHKSVVRAAADFAAVRGLEV